MYPKRLRIIRQVTCGPRTFEVGEVVYHKYRQSSKTILVTEEQGILPCYAIPANAAEEYPVFARYADELPDYDVMYGTLGDE